MAPSRARCTISALAISIAFAGASCGASATEERLVVFAAASLRDVFGELGRELERRRPGLEVTFDFAGTQALRARLEHGAPADVFASADPRHMDALAREGRVGPPVLFARNALVIVVPARSHVRAIGDLPSAERIVLGAREVPIGRYSEQVLDRASATLGADFRQRVEARVVSRELNVRQVLARVSLGEADAGIVYRTDVGSAPDVRVIEIPDGMSVIADYPIAVVTGAIHPALAREWIELVLSPEGQQALARAGFLAPGSPPATGRAAR